MSSPLPIFLLIFFGIIGVVFVAIFSYNTGHKQGEKSALGCVMRVEDIPRNKLFKFLGQVGTEYFLFAESTETKEGRGLRFDSRIARSPGGDRLNALNDGDQFMVVEKPTSERLVLLEFMKQIR